MKNILTSKWNFCGNWVVRNKRWVALGFNQRHESAAEESKWQDSRKHLHSTFYTSDIKMSISKGCVSNTYVFDRQSTAEYRRVLNLSQYVAIWARSK